MSAVAGTTARVARWVDVVADILSEPIREFPLGVVGRALVETFSADAASRAWVTPEGRPGFAIVAKPGATFGGRPLVESAATLASVARTSLLPHHPLVRWYRLTPGNAPQTMDRVPAHIGTARSVEAVQLMRQSGFARQLVIPLADRSTHALIVCRSAGEDFGSEDLEVAARIAPLFRALSLQAELVRSSTATMSASLLSARERAVIVLVARGFTARAISSHLNCAPRTVEKHLEHVYRKLAVTDRVSAVRVAEQAGVLGGSREGHQ